MNARRFRSRAALCLFVTAAAAGIAACGSTVSPGELRAGQVQTGDAGRGGLDSAPVPGHGPSGPVATSTGASPSTGLVGSARTPSSARSGSGPTAPGQTGSLASPNTAPLTIGLTWQDSGDVTSQFQFSQSNTLSWKQVADALVKGINAQGGLAGRKLKAVEYAFNQSDTNYSTDAQAACAKFTQDNHVSVVLDNGFGTDAGFRDCLQQARVLDITTGDEGDQASSQRATLHVNTAQLSHDRAYGSILEQLTATGYLSKANQLGIIVENCPEDTGPYARTLLPLIQRLGLKPPTERQVECTAGFASAAPDAQALNSAIVAFRAAGVDRVMFVSGFESFLLNVFTTSAEQQHYDPGYLLSSNAIPQQQEANVPASQLHNFHGVGNFPTTDVDGAPSPSAVETRCLHLSASGGADPSSYQDRPIVYQACGPFLLLEAALKLTNGDSRADTLMAAIDDLGASFKAPGLVEGDTKFTSQLRDGPSLVQVFEYQSGCHCLRYSGTPKAAYD